MTGENWNRLVTVIAGTGGAAHRWFTDSSGPGSIGRLQIPVSNRSVGLVSADWPTVGVVAVVAAIVVAIALRRIGARSNADGDRSGTEQPILTDRERVLRLLDGNGGRMKQSQIVDSVEWSKAKVSRLLAELESEEEVIKLRLGRENLICRPGYEPKASRSPRADGSRPAEPTHEATDEALPDE